MKKLFDALFGKSATPAKKIVSIACICTAILLIAAIVVLIVSSVMFSMRDGNDDDGNDVTPPPEIIYGTVESIDDHIVAADSFVNVRDNRSEMSGDTNQYYATSSKDVQLTAKTQKALDKMLVAFYSANRGKLVTDVTSENCNIPVVASVGSEGLVLTLTAFNDDSSISGNTVYSWIFSNAARYGFIYSGNTFTYVGAVHATYMSQSSITDFGAYKQALASGAVTVNVTDSVTGRVGTFTVYFIASGAELSVPSNYSYTAEAVDGGYVITVDMSKLIA